MLEITEKEFEYLKSRSIVPCAMQRERAQVYAGQGYHDHSRTVAKKKYPCSQGYFCKICGEYKANEKFSGKGYAAHICKVCPKLSAAEKAARMTLNHLENLLSSDTSKNQRKRLENRLHDARSGER